MWTTILWIVIAIVVVGVIIYLFKDKIFKKGGEGPTPPSSIPPTPPAGPTM